MADVKPLTGEGSVAASTPTVPARKPNPMWKYMGLGENFHPRLPSRNWIIFFALTGSFTAAVVHDKREKKRVQRKWCKLVEHVAKEPLGARAMPRKLTIYLEAPPKDGLRAAQEHFRDYVKPILVSSGLDWDIIQGRREGDIRTEVADRIRSVRLPPDQRVDEDDIAQLRRKNGIQEFEGLGGDIVVGRHTWKEYVRGLHEGWLGPVTQPLKAAPEVPVEDPEAAAAPGDASAAPSTEKPSNPEPFISTDAYPTAVVPVGIPAELGPSTPITFPHILGFLNTPRRLYRFLHRRELADRIGRETAAAILCTYRPYQSVATAEQETALQEEEKEWHKSIWTRVDGEPERTWLDPVQLHDAIAGRMRRFDLSLAAEQRAREILVAEEEIEGRIKGGLRGWYRAAQSYLGFRRDT